MSLVLVLAAGAGILLGAFCVVVLVVSYLELNGW